MATRAASAQGILRSSLLELIAHPRALKVCSGTKMQAKLPRAPGGGEPLPEGLLWLMLTGAPPF